MDYNFLKKFAFGSSYDSESVFTFANVDDMKKCNLYNMKEGTVVKTKGYYSKNDGGAAYYTISATASKGAITLDNGLYANILPDIYTDSEGNKWGLVNVKQFGATADDETADQASINAAIDRAGEYTAATEDMDRTIVYIPSGEYKCDNQIYVSTNNVNVVGDGDKSILYTDNDYRKTEGYSEHFFLINGASNCFFGHFTVKSKEVDLYHFMRQFTLISSTDICVYKVDLLIPKECYNCYYYEDKQYSNFCCYTGNTNITVDGCKMVQMTGTFRGANIGVLDIWAKGEKNVTIMNCDLYGNARDEQIGFFGTSNTNSHVNNVEFINNTIHAYQPLYMSTVGHANMRFTLGYSDSNDVSNIHIAGNHFIVECDSKFITFGKIKNCVIEDNIIEQYSTYATWSILIESNTYVSDDDVIIKHNDFYITSNEGLGKGNLLQGNSTFAYNRVFAETTLVFGVLGSKVVGNDITCLAGLGRFSTGQEVTGNTLTTYQGFGSCGGSSNRQAELFSASEGTMNFSDNTIYNYEHGDTSGNFQSLFKLDGSNYTLICDNNKYYCPNIKYTKASNPACVYKNEDEGLYYLKLWRNNTSGIYNIELKNNTFQGVVFTPMFNYDDTKVTLDASGNTTLPQTGNNDAKITTQVDMLSNGTVTNEITTADAKLDLDDIEYVDVTDATGNVTGKEKVTGKKVKYYSSVPEIAEVSDTGVVTRKSYGDVDIYCVPLDGSSTYGKCRVHFEQAKATAIQPQYTEKTLKVRRKDYIQCQVLPESASKELVYESSDSSVLKVSKTGVVEAVAAGSADVTCSTTDGSGVKQVIHYTVENPTVYQINLGTSSGSVEIGGVGSTCQLTASYSPSDAVNKGISRWESSDTDIATVSSTGLVTAVGGGVCDIYAYGLDDSFKGVTQIYVTPSAVANLQAEFTGNTSVTLSWDKTDGNYGYYIYRWDSENSEWVTACNNRYTTSTTYTITGLTAGTEYKFCVRAFISRWFSDGTRKVFESPDATTTVTTYTFKPVTNVTCYNSFIVLNEGDEVHGCDITMRVIDGSTYRDLEFEVEDSTVASIYSANYVSNYDKYQVSFKPLKAGYTNLLIKSTDGTGYVKKIPIGVFKQGTISNCSGKGLYKDAQITFDKQADESSIDGYVIRRSDSSSSASNATDPMYIPKTGKNTYTVDYRKNVEIGKTYNFNIYTYNLKDGIYYERLKATVSNITITDKIAVTNITANDSYMVKVGGTVNINAIVTPENASVQNLDWQICDGDVASVKTLKALDGSEYGVITGLKKGSTTLSLVAKDDTMVRKTVNIIVENDTTGWKKIDGRWYYVNSSYELQQGWAKIDGKWYYFGTDGKMATEWKQINSKWYYFGTNGAMLTGWKKLSNKWYYFGTDGKMVTEWKQINSKWYYFGTNGAMVTGWKKLDDNWYYFGTDGVMVTGQQTIDGKKYTFTNAGVMQ